MGRAPIFEPMRRMDSDRKRELRADRRQDILDQVRRGRLSPDQAEAIGVAEGLQPFAYFPDAQDINVLELTTWTIEMAMAWLIWQRPEKVALYHWPYRQECRAWFSVAPLTENGQPFDKRDIHRRAHALRQLKKATILDVERDAGRPDAAAMRSFEQAKTILWESLVSGEITASASSPAQPQSDFIRAQEWLLLEFEVNSPTKTYLHTNADGHENRYFDVVTPRLQVFEIIRKLKENITNLDNDTKPNKKGRGPTYKWDEIKKRAFQILDQYEQDRNHDELFENMQMSNAELKRKLFAEFGQRGPSESNLGKYVAIFLREYYQ